MTTYTHPFWARAIVETRMKIGDLDDLILVLVDYGSKINIITRNLYEKGKWPIDVNHGWVMRAATNERGNLYGACPIVKTKIDDVEVKQIFFVQNCSFFDNLTSQQHKWKPRYWMMILTMLGFVALMVSGMCCSSQSNQSMRNTRTRLQLREAALGVEDFQGL